MNLSLRKAGTLLVAGLAFAACSTDSNDSPLSPPLGMAVMNDGFVSFQVCKLIVTSFPPPAEEVPFPIEGAGEEVTFEMTPGGTQTVIAANGTGQNPVALCDRTRNPDAFTEEILVPIDGDLTITELAETAGGTLTLISSALIPFPTSNPGCSASPISRDGQTVSIVNVGDECTPEAREPYTFVFKNTFEPGDDETGIEGCTPGAWRNQDGTGNNGRNRWTGTPYDLTTTFESVFGDVFPDGSEYDGLTLREALDYNSNRGGEALLKHAAAAALNAAHEDVAYPYTLEMVVEMFQDAWEDLEADDNETKDLFDAANNLGCPI